MENLLNVSDLRTRFHTPEGTVYAVNGISFHLNEGESLAIVGESGCGKSVTMLSILGLIPTPPGEIYSGVASYRGKDLLKLTEQQLERVRGNEIAMIFQDPMTSLNPVLSIGRQISESIRTHTALQPAEIQVQTVKLLEMVGIPDPEQRVNNYPHQFSGGMRQRAMIAMALACQPSLLIADEPTTALDVTIQAQITELVIRLREQLGMAIIWITHDLGVVASIAERVVVMYAGFIVEEALVDQLYEAPFHPYTHALLEALPRADRRRDRRLKSISGAPPSLLVEPHGCPFAPRCDFVFERCRAEMPPIVQYSPGHKTACWFDITTGKPR
jgi:oligopeptide/dipeptide ABC transporter ATP-binding protein